MNTEGLVEFARSRVETKKASGRTPGAVYRKIFPAAEVFRDAGFAVSAITDELMGRLEWPQEKRGGLYQALARHFRNLEKK